MAFPGFVLRKQDVEHNKSSDCLTPLGPKKEKLGILDIFE